MANADIVSTETLRSEPKLSYAVKSKCFAALYIYHCVGGIKVNEADPRWRKDPKLKDFYQRLDTTTPYIHTEHFHEENSFYNLACPKGYGISELYEMRTCPSKDMKSHVTLLIREPFAAVQLRMLTLYCDEKGKAAWLARTGEKAKWVEHPYLPGFFETITKSRDETKAISSLVFSGISDEKNMPPGCRHLTKDEWNTR